MGYHLLLASNFCAWDQAHMGGGCCRIGLTSKQKCFYRTLKYKEITDISYIQNPAIGTFTNSHLKASIEYEHHQNILIQITVLYKGFLFSSLQTWDVTIIWTSHPAERNHINQWKSHHFIPPHQVMATARGALVAFQVSSWSFFWGKMLGGHLTEVRLNLR